MLEAGDFNDNTILSTTKVTPDQGGQVQYSIVIPSGRTVTSDWMKAEEASKYVVKWCEAIRGEVANDLSRQARKNVPETGEPPTTGSTTALGQGAPAPKKSTVQDPRSLVRDTIERLTAKHNALIKQVAAAVVSRDAVLADLTEWNKAAAALGLELKEEANDE